MQCHLRKKQAFTLPEVLVALLVLAVLSVVFWQFFSSATRFQSHQSDYMSSMAEVMKVWRYLEDDLAIISLSYPYKPIEPSEEELAKLGLTSEISAADFPLRPRFNDYIALYDT